MPAKDSDSHHVLRRLFGLSDEQIQDVTGSRQKDTGFTQSGFHSKLTARLAHQQNLTFRYQRSDQDDVRGYKDLWGGLGRLRSDFQPQRLQFFYTRYEKLRVGRPGLAERHVLDQLAARWLDSAGPASRPTGSSRTMFESMRSATWRNAGVHLSGRQSRRLWRRNL